MHRHFEAVGVPSHTEEECQFAREIRATLSDADKELDVRFDRRLAGKELADVLAPYRESTFVMPGSTDVGDVSWVVPTAQCQTVCDALGTPFHTWQMVTQGATSIGHKGMLHAGKVIAATALEAMQSPELIAAAKAELKDRLRGETYRSPIPPEVTHYEVQVKR